jgi:hypothetical protein
VDPAGASLALLSALQGGTLISHLQIRHLDRHIAAVTHDIRPAR